MGGGISAYVDTAAFIALLDRSDSYHSLFRFLFSDPPQLLTSALTVAEGHGWFLRRYDGRRALEFMRFIEDLGPTLSTEAFGPADLPMIQDQLRRYPDQPLTIADAHGLALMERRRISTCWSTDRHLSLVGARLVIY